MAEMIFETDKEDEAHQRLEQELGYTREIKKRSADLGDYFVLKKDREAKNPQAECRVDWSRPKPFQVWTDSEGK